MARKKRPIKLITLDTETYNGLIGKLKRIAIYDGVSVTYGYTFTDIETKLIQYYEEGFDVHIYIHNIEFDARKIPEIFSDDRIIWEKCFIINNKLATVGCKKYTFHDSFKLLPMSLKKLSKDFGVEHAKLDLWEEVQNRYKDEYKDIVDFLDRCDVDNELYLEYLGYDVISLYEVIQKLIEISGIPLNDFVNRISTASLSRYIFKNGWKEHKFKSDDSNKTDYDFLCSYNYRNDLYTEEFLRESYCGGRTEVFKPELISKGKHYDVNSLYPSVMKGNFPIGKPKHVDDEILAEDYFNKWMNNHIGIGFLYCDVFIPEQHIPPLPVKMGKLAFVCGHVYGVWNFEELEYAIKECGVIIEKFHEVVFYEKTYPVFKRFIETMYSIKEEGTKTKNDALRTFGKLLMNVGYGYTGMRRDDKTSLKDIKHIDKYEEIKFADEQLGYIEVPTEIKAEYIQVAVASTVTCRARLVLLKALKYCDKLGDVYYCDTDSIVTNVTLPDEMVDSAELGKWDLEGEPLKALFLKPKVYSEVLENETNIKFKGISRETQKELDFDYYEYLRDELEETKKDYIVVEKNRTTFRSIMYMKKKGLDDEYFEVRDKKMNLNTIEKRIIDYKENYTKAYYFDSIEDFNKFSFSNYKKKVSMDLCKEV